jgi:hypothetical protein
MSRDETEALEAEMVEALEREDFETAAQVRDRLAALNPDAPTRLHRGVPGAMGLGTDQARRRPPEGWVPPTRPDPGTAHVKRGGGRRRT